MNLFHLDKIRINNLNKIIKMIVADINFEHIGDIIFMLDKYDKKRNLNDDELKIAVYTIIKVLIEDYHFKAMKNYDTKKNEHLVSIDDVFLYLEKNWNISDIREYLLFFIKP